MIPASRLICPAVFGLALLSASPADAAALDGAQLSAVWSLPFLGVLGSIATGPLLFPHLWEHHYGKIAAAWATIVIAALALSFGAALALESLLHVLLLEYVPFIVLLFTLYTIAGGILVKGDIPGTPAGNAALLTVGGVLASFVGTTGASMILIRPLLQANRHRPHNVHVVVFFIFLVANIGGALTPLGDPPLFVGFLRGVDFFWTTRHLALETVFVFALVLGAFYMIDRRHFRRERGEETPRPAAPLRLAVEGRINLVLLAGVIATVLLSAAWTNAPSIPFPGGALLLSSAVRDLVLIALAIASLRLTPKAVRAGNDFEWEPIVEVAKLFAAIFICIVPVIAKLQAGEAGVFAPLIEAVTDANGEPHNLVYFWATGLLSAFLDNAPTYLVFFELAGGDAAHLMGPRAATLAAISLGAVCMGALTYIGNAPNFMIYAVARRHGIEMPSFFGFLGWSVAILGRCWWSFRCVSSVEGRRTLRFLQLTLVSAAQSVHAPEDGCSRNGWLRV